ncbi:MAG: hypothetical protein BWK73_13905 [Thiothrix lacustris]|uniref:Tip attachment protein J domain-containing protein n=1 Tax=Thiothrix lacustris TaxID=525917 RepID=A0A1Y1QSF7_9GAMM|nr:MAG: hypothetical protein BWK73_13905 [Thiothrix lacustris]
MSINLADWSLWELSAPNSNTAGKALHGGDFTPNGDGNSREMRLDPWDNPAMVWVSSGNDATSDADGGWNKYIANIDPTKKHLSFVYFRRVSDSAAGRFYHGCASASWGSQDATETLGAGAISGNPYFNSLLISALTKSEWYVSIGVIHEAGYAGGYSGLAGIYRVSDGAKVFASTEYRQKSGATVQMHRIYLYYSTSPLDEIEWWNPGFYAMDGTEPTLAKLLEPPKRTPSQSHDDWLLDPRNQRYRATLIEIHADSGLYRLATQPYFQPDGAWDDLLLDEVVVESALDASVSVGDFTFSDDYRTHWGVEDFYGRPCRVWLGDTRWARDAFVQIADLVIDHIQRQDDGVYRVTFTDSMPLLEEKIIGTKVNGQPMPVAYGSPRNVTPIMTDYLTRVYRFSESALTAISAVRDRGKTPSTITKLLPTGSVKIGVNVAGTITGDVTAAPTFLRDVVAALLTRAGIATTAASIVMRRFPTAYPNGYPLDIYIDDQPTYRDLLQSICESCGASLAREANGAYSLTYITFDSTPSLTLTSDDILPILRTV